MIIYIKNKRLFKQKGAPPPGPKLMWIDIQKMHGMTVGFELAKIFYN